MGNVRAVDHGRIAPGELALVELVLECAAEQAAALLTVAGDAMRAGKPIALIGDPIAPT